MSTERAQALLAALLAEPGVSGTLLPLEGTKFGVNLTLDVPLALRSGLESIFDSNGKHMPRGMKRKRDAEDDDDDEEAAAKQQTGDDELLDMYRRNSGRQLHKLRPDVWTSHGRWSKGYAHLDGKIVKEKKGAGGYNGRVTNRPFVSLYSLNGKDIEVGFVVQQAKDYHRIIIAFTRASSAPPTYGAQGMFDRGAAAAKAWSALSLDHPGLIFSLPRARVASKWPLSERRALVGEMVAILDAAPDGMTVELLSVGLDGLTTDLGSLQWLHQTWGHRLKLTLVVAVPSAFPGSRESFSQRLNGIRYGVFPVSVLVLAMSDTTLPDLAECRELVGLLRRVRDDKEDRDDGYADLSQLTFGRANFRVCPDSAHVSGVQEELIGTRALQQQAGVSGQ